MILFPAIDLKDGQCVRLKLGDMDQATVFNDNPGAQARAFEDQGFEWLHVVDLNGAFAGESVNGAAVDAILGATKNPVQLGGGIRTLEHIETWLDKGISRVILGTVAVRDPDLVKEEPKILGTNLKGKKARRNTEDERPVEKRETRRHTRRETSETGNQKPDRINQKPEPRIRKLLHKWRVREGDPPGGREAKSHRFSSKIIDFPRKS